jgi:hypothetical protein
MKLPAPATIGIEIAYDVSRSVPIAVAYLSGSIDPDSGPVLRGILDLTVEGGAIVVDLSHVASINVGGLFALHAAAIDVRTLHGGCLVLHHVDDSIRWLLDVLPLDLPIEEVLRARPQRKVPVGLWNSAALFRAPSVSKRRARY